MTRSVEESWEIIRGWLSLRAPHVAAMLAPPATDADLRAVEEAHGVALPPDLVSLWRGANGPGSASMSFNLIVPPGFMLTGTRFAIEHLHRTRWIATDPANQCLFPGEEVDEQALADQYDATVAELMRRPAGTGDYSSHGLLAHLPAWIMFAREKDCYFVDCRPGEQHGCVMRQGAYGGWGGPLWPSVAAMWEETADVLAAIGPDDEPDRVPTSVGEWWLPRDWWRPLGEDPSAVPPSVTP